MSHPHHILLFGARGQVGWELQRTLTPLGAVVAVNRQQADLTDEDAIRAVIRQTQPSLVVNAAAYTAVDRAEDEPEIARQVNAVAPGIMAEEAARLDAPLVHYSTDYVFEGTATSPYSEADTTNPLSVYGQTKLAGEQAVGERHSEYLVFRTSWVYGLRRSNFLATMLRLAQTRSELQVVDDQAGAPTWCRSIAETTAFVLARWLDGARGREQSSGIYHLSSRGQTSWCGFAEAIFDMFIDEPDERPRVSPIPTSAYPTKATRPAYSVLDGEKLQQSFGAGLPDWRTALELACAEARDQTQITSFSTPRA